jgi:hypothetical protein
MKNQVQDFLVWASTLENNYCDAQDLKKIGYLVSMFLGVLEDSKEEENVIEW